MRESRILIVEDEPGLVKTLSWYFAREGYETFSTADGKEGLHLAQTKNPDVMLLDIMLPGMSGLEVCKTLRLDEKTREIPIIFITARSEEADQVAGYAIGADDYVTKPFTNKVLLAKVKALLRRVSSPPEPNDVMEAMGVKIDRVRHRVMVGDERIELTPTEFRLLECMLRQPGRAFSRVQLKDAAIGAGQIVEDRTIDVHIKTLRRKLMAALPEGTPDLIETVRGIGYRFLEEPKS